MRKYLKYFILLIVFIIIIVPRETYAESGYTQLWKRLYRDINYTQVVHQNNYDTNGIDLKGGGRGSVYLYPQDFTFSQKSYDFISGAGVIQSSSLGGIYIEDYNVSGSVTALFGVGLSLMVEGNEGSGNDITRGSICTIYPTTQTNDEFYFTYNCPIINTMGKIVQFKFILHNNCDTILNQTCSTNSNYYFTVGIGPTINAHLLDNTQEQIVESQQETKDAINNMNSNITNSSTNGNNISGSTSQIEGMIPQDEKSEGFYNNIFTFYNRVNDSIDTTCSNYTLSLMEQTIVFPCINMANIFGSWWSIIDILCCIWPLFNIFNLIIGWVDGITDLEDLSYFKSAKHIHWSREDYRKGMYY